MVGRRRVRPPRTVDPWPFVGMVLMATAFFLYAASGLLAPWWGVALLLLLWVALFVLCCVWWSRHPRRLPVVGVAAIVMWFVLVTAGGVWLGWSA